MFGIDVIDLNRSVDNDCVHRSSRCSVIQIMHIREVVSKNYSPEVTLLKSETHEAESECVLEFYKVTEGG